ncbi:D-arabinono-1,4-lactone oxidase [Nesterenkonia lacusekhoensis]|nr:D-arabinono-1,4-lactone oxidase [Nesterenkonia lacusekhoensis]
MARSSVENWSGSISFTPQKLARPGNERDVVRLVRRARRRGSGVRPIGSGHSSTPLMNTDDVLVSLDRMSGVVEADPDLGRASILPGTGLSELGAELEQFGLAMENLGDVDYQTIAGALGTGTHGSGITLGNLSSTMIGGRLVTGTGEVLPFGVDAGEDPSDPLARAAQVSLGTLGILTSVTLQLEEAHELHRQNWMTHIDWVLEHFDQLVRSHRSVDFYWYPRSDLAQVRTLDKPGQEPDLMPPGELKKDVVGPNYEVIPNDRHLKFEEMEYMLPLDTSLEAFREVRRRVKEVHRSQVGWRVLVRTIAADQAMISNAQHRQTMTIALLQNHSLPYEDYFDDLEPVFREFRGRPHWGKKHSLKAPQLRMLYPEWADFQALRRDLDPDGIFLNDYLRELFGEEDR